MADRNALLENQYGLPLFERRQAKGVPSDWERYDRTSDPLAMSRVGGDMMRSLGFGNPLGVIPGTASIV
jgi:hypothetical protein